MVISIFTVAKFGSSKLTISDCTEHFSFGANTSVAVKSIIFSSIIKGGLANTALSINAMDPCQLPLHTITDVIIPGAMIPGNSSYVSGNPLANSLRKIFLSLVRLVSNFNSPFFEQTKQDANGSYASCSDLFGFVSSTFAAPTTTAGCNSELHGFKATVGCWFISSSHFSWNFTT